jgi:hypothetical protein
MNLHDAQQQFQLLSKNVQRDDVVPFLRWVQSMSETMIQDVESSKEDIIINEVREDIKASLPLHGLVPTERVMLPQAGENADCNASNTVYVDAFLYDEDDIDDLCDDGKMSRNYCQQCGSQQVKPLTFVSHSSSVTQLKYMFQYLIPPHSLDGKVLLDIGSRLGAVLYGAALYNGSRGAKLVGVEMNAELCLLQSKAIEKYHLSNYAQFEVVCSDITGCGEIVQAADVIVMNNIFDFFVPLEIQSSIWQFLHSNITRSGTRLLLTPMIESSLEHLQVNIDIKSWLVKLDVTDQLATANLHLFGCETSEDSDLSDIHLYSVL